MLNLIDIKEDSLPNVGDLITDTSDGSIGLIYDIRLKTYLVYWIHLNNNMVLDTKETSHSLYNFKLIPT